MVSEAIKSLKRKYKNQDGVKIGRDLIQPCLKECVKYRRGTGTFSSSAFKAYIGAIDHFIHDEVKIEILCSPKIDDILLRSLEKCTASYDRDKILQRTTNELLLAAAGCKSDPDRADYRSMLLSYLIANNKLEIKIALPLSNPSIQTFDSDDDDFDMDDINSRAMYHIKYGYFVFPDKSIVAFEGSVNESDTAFNHNTEKATVYRSWDEYDVKSGRLNDVIEDLDKDWEGKNNDIRIYSIDAESLQIIRDHAPSKRPQNSRRITPFLENPPETVINEPSESDEAKKKWRHQDEAVKIFLKEKSGILEMATGTGKTKTALKILNELFSRGEIDQFIITCYGTDLLNQWEEEIRKNKVINEGVVTRLFNANDNSHIDRFRIDPMKSGLIVSIDKVHTILSRLDQRSLSRTLIIYDEVHNLGSEGRLARIRGLNDSISYKLGLSATPDKGEFNIESTEAIKNEIGDVIFKFDIEDAIKRGILVEFDYIALKYQLTQDDKNRKRSVYASQSIRRGTSNPMSSEELARELAKVYKLSKSKIPTFADFLRNEENNKILESCIIFVQQEDYGSEVLEILHTYTNNYRTYYSNDSEEILKEFAKENIDVLITCKKLSQGIDIPSLRNIVIFSSDKEKLVTIQRLGRCIRFDPNNPNKRAKVVDFYEDSNADESYDQKRYDWLTELSKTKLEG
jgi:superfamily II DNA or RNA helicase